MYEGQIPAHCDCATMILFNRTRHDDCTLISGLLWQPDLI
jgi:hypothetical protein